MYRALKPSGSFWLAIGDEYAAELKILSQEIGFHSRSWVVWYYTFGVNCVNKFTRSHAHLFYFVKDPASFTFRGDAPENRIPSARQLVYNDSRANPKGRLPDDTWILRPQDMADCFTPEEDTWYFPRVAGTFKERAGFHGCQMPEQLLGRIFGGKVSKEVLNFLKVLSRHNRLGLVPLAAKLVTKLHAERRGLTDVEVRVAAPLDDATLSEIKNQLRKSLGKEPVVTMKVDPALIAGIVVRVGDRVYDGSVSSQLERTRAAMIHRATHQIDMQPERFFATVG